MYAPLTVETDVDVGPGLGTPAAFDPVMVDSVRNQTSPRMIFRLAGVRNVRKRRIEFPQVSRFGQDLGRIWATAV
jgi:hypothetical protein